MPSASAVKFYVNNEVVQEMEAVGGMHRRPLTANPPTQHRVHSAMASGIYKKFGFQPSEIMRGTNVDILSFVGAGSLKEDHTKLFNRIDTLVEK